MQPPLRFRLWHLIAVVAITGLIAGGLVWLFPPQPSGWCNDVVVAGYQIPLTWPVLLATPGVILITLITLGGIVGGLLAMLVRATRRSCRSAKKL
jgi:hypothetical protein